MRETKKKILKLSKKDSEVFIAALLNPPEPNKALRKLLKKYKATVAQRPERRYRKPRVGGSNPSCGPIFRRTT